MLRKSTAKTREMGMNKWPQALTSTAMLAYVAEPLLASPLISTASPFVVLCGLLSFAAGPEGEY